MPGGCIDEASLPIADVKCVTDVDRRRPGRVDVSPSLIPMLRAPADFDLTEEDRRFLDLDDQQSGGAVQENLTSRLGAARDLVLAIILIVPMWLVIHATFYLFR